MTDAPFTEKDNPQEAKAHTPGPWRIRHVQSGRYRDDPHSLNDVAVVDELDRIVAETFERVAQGVNYPAAANAAFIVRACNSHEALLAALEGLFNTVGEHLALLTANEDDCGQLMAAQSAALDAIKKARGE